MNTKQTQKQLPHQSPLQINLHTNTKQYQTRIYCQKSPLPWKYLFLIGLFRLFQVGLITIGSVVSHPAIFYDRYIIRMKAASTSVFLSIFALCYILPGNTMTQLSIALCTFYFGNIWLGGILGVICYSLTIFIIIGIRTMLAHVYHLDGLLTHLKGFELITVSFYINMLIQARGKFLSFRMLPVIIISAIIYYKVNDDNLITYEGILIVLSAGFVGLFYSNYKKTYQFNKIVISKKTGSIMLITFFILLLIMIDINMSHPSNSILGLFGTFFRLGSEYTGLSDKILIENSIGKFADNLYFLSKSIKQNMYGQTMYLPGPDIRVAAFAGGVYIYPIMGLTLGYILINLPSFLLIIGVLPFWLQAYKKPQFVRFCNGMSCGVLGIFLKVAYEIGIKQYRESLSFPDKVKSMGVVILCVILLRFKIPNFLVLGFGLFINRLFFFRITMRQLS